REIKIIKQQLQQLTIKQKQDAEAIKFLLQNAVNKEEEEEEENEEEEESEKILSIENSQDIPEDFIYILREITTQKYLIRITLCLTENFQIDTIALFDTGADLNCIKHGIIPSTFISKTQEKLKAANNSKLTILGQTDAFILNNKIRIKNPFIIVSEIHHMVILGSPFINTI